MSDDRYRRGDVYGLLAEFDSPESLREAAQKLWLRGYRRVGIYTPFPMTELNSMFGKRHFGLRLRTLLVSPIVFLGGVIGALTAIVMQEYANVIDYPLNIGGRPFNSWPAFVPVTFELTILGAAIAGLIGIFVLNGLPQFYHPLFNDPRFARATQDRYFLCAEAIDRKFDRMKTKELLESTPTIQVREVQW